jgi:hypothetical protein
MSCQKSVFEQQKELFFMQDPIDADDPAPTQPQSPQQYNFFARENLNKWAPIISLVLTLILVIRGN